MLSAPCRGGEYLQRRQLRQAAACTAAAQAGKLLGSDCSSSSIVRSSHPQRLLRTLASRAAKDPSRASAAETASAAAASAEAAAQAAAVSSPAASSWLHNMRNHVAQLQNNLAQAVSKGRNWKPAKISLPGMKVEFDMLNPTLTTIKTHSLELWASLPPRAREAAPFVGTAAVSILVTRAIFSFKLSSQEAAAGKLQGELSSLQDRHSVLHAQYKSQQSQLEAPRAMREVQMAEAVAQATSAAAAAATAAATAAEAAAAVISSRARGKW